MVEFINPQQATCLSLLLHVKLKQKNAGQEKTHGGGFQNAKTPAFTGAGLKRLTFILVFQFDINQRFP